MTPLTGFVLFNLIGAPLIGRLVWLGMGALHGQGAVPGAVALSVVAAIAILAANLALTRAAARAGLPKSGVMALGAVTLLTFGLTVGTGFFSPLNLVWALVRA
ncbi:MAG: hypothetical protein RQ752_15285 [Thermohalobaculum sp.]|nr:hypothetical protein [Thermohalobaculum sp.]